MITARYIVRYVFMVIAIGALCFMVSYDNLIWLAYAAAAAGVISAAVCLVSRRSFTVSVFTKEGELEEGRRVGVTVRLEKTGVCLLPLIELEVGCGAERVTAAGSLLFNRSVDIPLTLTVSECGLTEITARVLLVHDFVDAVCFQPQRGDSITVAVLPELKKREFSIAASKEDDSSEAEISLPAYSGSLGYEVRQYQDGDTLRSISYKLSAKYGRLLTRVSEKSSGRLVRVLILGGSGCNAARIAVSLAQYLTDKGMLVYVEYNEESIVVSSDEIEALRRWLSVRRFVSKAEEVTCDLQKYDFIVSDDELPHTELVYREGCGEP